MDAIESWTGRIRAASEQQRADDAQFNQCAAGDVLFGKLRPYLAKVAKAEFPMNCSSEFLVLRPQCYSASFLRYSLLNARLIDAVNAATYGTKMPRANWETVGNLKLPLPSISEQRAIAAYLDEKTAEIDGLIADIERSIELLQEYRTSVISEAVTKGLDPCVPMKDSGVEWIDEIPAHWDTLPLKRIVSGIESGTSVDGAKWPASNTEKGVLSLSAVYQGEFRPQENKAVKSSDSTRLSCPVRKGTLLISRCNTSEWVGTAAYVDNAPANLYLPDKLWQLSFNSDELTRFVRYALQSAPSRAFFASISVGASQTMQNIAKEDLLAIRIAVPAAMEISRLVRELDSQTASIDSLIDDKHAAIDRLREYRKSLISEAVTGKFKVPGVA